MKLLIALGGNAMTAPDGSARPEDQRRAIEQAMETVADLIAQGHDVILTHGNGPQVGNLLVKNELAAQTVPPVSLDWCGAQTQGTIGFTVLNALEGSLQRRGIDRPTAAIVTRTLVDADDPAFAEPSKPVGRFLPADQAQPLVDLGQNWQDRGEKGWRRVVASPQPVEVADWRAIRTLVEAGFVVVAGGGGGIPVTRLADGTLAGVEAVIDKDLTAAMLAHQLDVDALVIATDVPYAVIGYGTQQARNVERVTITEMEHLAAEGHFASGSMAPKVEAALRFVRAGGTTSIITALDTIADALAGTTGTVIVADPA